MLQAYFDPPLRFMTDQHIPFRHPGLSPKISSPRYSSFENHKIGILKSHYRVSPQPGAVPREVPRTELENPLLPCPSSAPRGPRAGGLHSQWRRRSDIRMPRQCYQPIADVKRGYQHAAPPRGLDRDAHREGCRGRRCRATRLRAVQGERRSGSPGSSSEHRRGHGYPGISQSSFHASQGPEGCVEGIAAASPLSRGR